ncbi:MAG: hypothetical protein JW791_04680 [Nanoarchaeota archaeon]|nr:hypothetical protein [Nanoarchaeota archaeon]
MVKNHEWNNLLSHYEFVKAVKVNLSRRHENDTLQKSVDNVFSRKSVLIVPKNNHFILIYYASHCCNDVIVQYHDPEAGKNEEYGNMGANDLESQIINSGNSSFFEIIIKE